MEKRGSRILGIDPGTGKPDPTGIVGISVVGLSVDDHAYAKVILAETITGTPQEQAAKIHELYYGGKPRYVIVEKNGFVGQRLIRELRIPHMAVTTCGSENPPTETMCPKPYMTKLIYLALKEGWLTIPRRHESLIDQINNIVTYKTQTGATGCKAARSGHDDLFMALMLACLPLENWT